MKNKISIINIILILATLISDIYYIMHGTILVKTITSMWFVLLGVVNVGYAVKSGMKSIKFLVAMLLALIFSFGGDVVLYYDFIIGAILFATAHILYFVAYCIRDRFRIKDLIPSIIILVPAVSFLVLAPIFDYGSPLMEVVCVAYAVIISCMVGKAVANLRRNKNTVNVLVVVGSALFFFSDLMLVLNVFGGAPHITDTLCLLTYYPSQCFLGYSMYKVVMEKSS